MARRDEKITGLTDTLAHQDKTIAGWLKQAADAGTEAEDHVTNALFTHRGGPRARATRVRLTRHPGDLQRRRMAADAPTRKRMCRREADAAVVGRARPSVAERGRVWPAPSGLGSAGGGGGGSCKLSVPIGFADHSPTVRRPFADAKLHSTKISRGG